MKSSLFSKILTVTVLTTAGFLTASTASAQYYTVDPSPYTYYNNGYYGGSTYGMTPYYGGYDQSALIDLLNQLIAQLQQYPGYTNYSGYGYNYNNYYSPYGYAPTSGYDYYYNYNNGDKPDVTTRSADNVDNNSAELNGEVDMNDFHNGIVFFVYGQDEDMVRDVEDDYDTYDDVRDDQEDDDFETERVDSDLDGSDDYAEDVNGLQGNRDYYFTICVEYEDNSNDERLECGSIKHFETD